MTQEEKQLLLKDLCARLPYGVRIKRETITGSYARVEFTLSLETFDHLKIGIQEDRYSIKPYLRPMSSMTEEELKMFKQLQVEADEAGTFEGDMLLYDWLNKNHFDYRLLIFQGLALEAPEEMYKTE